MTDGESYDFVMRFFRITSRYENHAEFWWRTDGKYAPLTIFANCNDLFFWGTADSEAVTPENIGELERACEDASRASRPDEPKDTGGGYVYGASLFCARVRGMRPQGACYRNFEKGVAALFDACGPEREVNVANPKPNAIKE